jgi:plastocyanin
VKEQLMRVQLPAKVTVGVGVAATAAVVGSGVALAAPHATSAALSSSTATAKTVTIKNFAFSPRTVTIRHGASIRWINRDTTTHTTTSNTHLWSKTLIPGKSFTFTFGRRGSYHYHCSIHPMMTGIVRVT